MPAQLSLATLPMVPAAMQPRYDPGLLQPGIVHIGCGAFHRAHQAVYTHDALNAAGGDWGIIGASLKQPAVRNHLRNQQGLYSVISRGPESADAVVIGCIRDVVFTPDDPASLPQLIARESVRIVSLTVTEKGYCLHAPTRSLDFEHPDVQHDILHPELPRTAIGTLVAGLRARRRAHGRPLTVICCDNLQHNGALLRALTLSYASAVDPPTGEWIADNVSFPDTMVDRIVPATTPEALSLAQNMLGLRDEAAIACEPFRQWVLEDDFAAGRPLWEAGGAQIVPSVRPYEEMKLKLLNGSNSLLAYLGHLAGHDYISQAMQDSVLATLVQRFMEAEAAPAIGSVPSGTLASYQRTVLERFANPNLRHRCLQIAMDGSQKLPQRFFDTVRNNLAAGRPIRLCALAIAAWMRYASGMDEKGKPVDVLDPLAGELLPLAQGDAASVVPRLLSLRTVFPEDLAGNRMFAEQITAALERLQRNGSRHTAAAMLEAA